MRYANGDNDHESKKASSSSRREPSQPLLTACRSQKHFDIGIDRSGPGQGRFHQGQPSLSLFPTSPSNLEALLKNVDAASAIVGRESTDDGIAVMVLSRPVTLS